MTVSSSANASRPLASLSSREMLASDNVGLAAARAATIASAGGSPPQRRRISATALGSAAILLASNLR
jgi:hypothetical protein